MRDVLRSVWDEPRAPDPPRRVRRDWALTGGLVALAVVEGLVRRDLPNVALWVLVLVAIAPTLLWRRTHPLPMLAAAFAVGAVPVLAGAGQSELFSMGFLLVLPYALYRWGSGREIVGGTAIVLASTVLSFVTSEASLGDTVGGTAVVSTTAAVAVALRTRAGAHARDLQQARLLERARLARDLHDTVAHHVSAMAVRAQAGLAQAPANQDAATDALRVIAAEASRTLDEMRAIVGVLREGDAADLAPSPRIRDLQQLASAPGAGPAVDVVLTGDVDEVAAPVATGVYRLAQEAVTNARRHARRATRIDVRVDADDRSVQLQVRDDGEAAAARPTAAPGYGVAGMAERAGLLGGTCDAGPDAAGGWTVTAVLPRNRAAT